MLEFITLPDGLPPVAPYSHAVRAGDFLFVTGQLAEDVTSGEVLKLDIEAQTRQVMENLQRVLTHAGTRFNRLNPMHHRLVRDMQQTLSGPFDFADRIHAR